MSTLPTLNEILVSSPDHDSPLAKALAILFEGSPTLFANLVPGLALSLSTSSPIDSYGALIDAALVVIALWPDTLRAQFIAGHPRIGEVKGLSHLSAKEQAAQSTPPEILVRLTHLNACYERRYPGLRYITFVNGRSRTTIKDEMEGVLGFARSVSADQPPLESVGSIEVSGAAWKDELDRAVVDVGRIAKSRLESLGVE